MLKITLLAKNLFLLLMAKDAKSDSDNDDYKNKTVKRLPFKNLNRVIDYLTPNAK